MLCFYVNFLTFTNSMQLFSNKHKQQKQSINKVLKKNKSLIFLGFALDDISALIRLQSLMVGRQTSILKTQYLKPTLHPHPQTMRCNLHKFSDKHK